MTKPTAALVMRSLALRDELFDRAALERLHRVVDVDGQVITSLDDEPSRKALARTQLLVTSWGAPYIDDALLALAPELRAVVHSAGTVKTLLDPVVWERGIVVSSAATANARPVAEYTLAMIALASKRVLEMSREFRHHQGFDGWQFPSTIGNYGRTVGIIGASRTGRQVMELLASFDVDILLYDPLITDRDAAAWGACVTSFAELVKLSDVVSLHAPALPSTRHMIGAAELSSMRGGATLINTARGSLVDHDALVAELGRRSLYAILDVTEPEPLPAGHPLYEHPQVLLTPHIAGSLGNELRRLGESAVAEIERYTRGEPFLHGVKLEDLSTSA